MEATRMVNPGTSVEDPSARDIDPVTHLRHLAACHPTYTT